MNETEQLEWDLLEYIADWMRDNERPSDEAILEFPGGLAELRTLRNSSAPPSLQQERLENVARELDAAGYIAGESYDGAMVYRLTRQGYTLLEQYRDRRGWRRIKRWFAQWSDRVLASIVTPIVVSVLTVLVMRFLGLEG